MPWLSHNYGQRREPTTDPGAVPLPRYGADMSCSMLVWCRECPCAAKAASSATCVLARLAPMAGCSPIPARLTDAAAMFDDGGCALPPLHVGNHHQSGPMHGCRVRMSALSLVPEGDRWLLPQLHASTHNALLPLSAANNL